jgi:hypothetical protein
MLSCLSILAANAVNGPVLERLDPPRRAAVVMALLALVLTGLMLVMCAMLGGHWVRRLARHQPGTRSTGAASNGAVENRRLRESLADIIPTAQIGDTLHIDTSTKDTTADP